MQRITEIGKQFESILAAKQQEPASPLTPYGPEVTEEEALAAQRMRQRDGAIYGLQQGTSDALAASLYSRPLTRFGEGQEGLTVPAQEDTLSRIHREMGQLNLGTKPGGQTSPVEGFPLLNSYGQEDGPLYAGEWDGRSPNAITSLDEDELGSKLDKTASRIYNANRGRGVANAGTNSVALQQLTATRDQLVEQLGRTEKAPALAASIQSRIRILDGQIRDAKEGIGAANPGTNSLALNHLTGAYDGLTGKLSQARNQDLAADLKGRLNLLTGKIADVQAKLGC